MIGLQHTQSGFGKVKSVPSPWSKTFENFVRSIHCCAIMVSPFITAPPLKTIASLLDANNWPRITLLTNLATDSLLQGTVDGTAIAEFCKEIPTVTIRHLPGLHAKAYVADEHTAIITSGNLTRGSLYENYEYGIQINDSVLVREIARDLQEYGSLGASVSLEELERLADIAETLKDTHAKKLNSARRNLRQEFENQLVSVQHSLLQLRGKPGESTNAIFSRTILYLLKRGPLPTVEMHPFIQNIHPDLCNDQIDRVIKGIHHGKLWKHRVRSAQSSLKERGLIERVNGYWRLTVDP